MIEHVSDNEFQDKPKEPWARHRDGKVLTSACVVDLSSTSPNQPVYRPRAADAAGSLHAHGTEKMGMDTAEEPRVSELPSKPGTVISVTDENAAPIGWHHSRRLPERGTNPRVPCGVVCTEDASRGPRAVGKRARLHKMGRANGSPSILHGSEWLEENRN